MSNDLNRSIKIYIDGTEAALGVKQVETAIQKLENKLASLNKSEANYNTQSRKLQLIRKRRLLKSTNKVSEKQNVF